MNQYLQIPNPPFVGSNLFAHVLKMHGAIVDKSRFRKQHMEQLSINRAYFNIKQGSQPHFLAILIR